MQSASSKTHFWNDIIVKQIVKGNWVQLQKTESYIKL